MYTHFNEFNASLILIYLAIAIAIDLTYLLVSSLSLPLEFGELSLPSNLSS